VAERRWGERAVDLALVVAAALAVTLALDVLDLPSPSLFGGLVAGLVLSRGRPRRWPRG
jgi:uncharacterized membrane protein AbrB (regulator of aidB expression)